MVKKSPKAWWKVKAKIISRYGTLTGAAAALDCSVEGLRLAVGGKCPGILKKLEALLQEEPVA